MLNGRGERLLFCDRGTAEKPLEKEFKEEYSGTEEKPLEKGVHRAGASEGGGPIAVGKKALRRLGFLSMVRRSERDPREEEVGEGGREGGGPRVCDEEEKEGRAVGSRKEEGTQCPGRRRLGRTGS